MKSIKYFDEFDPYITYTTKNEGVFWRDKNRKTFSKRLTVIESQELFALWDLGRFAFELVDRKNSAAEFGESIQSLDDYLSKLNESALEANSLPTLAPYIKAYKAGHPFAFLYLQAMILDKVSSIEKPLPPSLLSYFQRLESANGHVDGVNHLAVASLQLIDFTLCQIILKKGSPLRMSLEAAKFLRFAERIKAQQRGAKKAVKRIASSNAKLGHKDDYANKAEVIKYFEKNESRFKSAEKAAEEIKNINLVLASVRTIAGWIREHKKSRGK